MKFDYIIGNPPYQESISDKKEGNSSLAKQLFPSFVEAAISTGTERIALITPSRWFTADAQDKSFVKMRNNKFLQILERFKFKSKTYHKFS